MYTAIITGIAIIVAFGIICGSLSSPAIVDIDSYPAYIHIVSARPVPIYPTTSSAGIFENGTFPAAVNGVNGS